MASKMGQSITRRPYVTGRVEWQGQGDITREDALHGSQQYLSMKVYRGLYKPGLPSLVTRESLTTARHRESITFTRQASAVDRVWRDDISER